MKDNCRANVLMNTRAFTLIEILLVVIILGILIGLVAPRYAGRSEEVRKQAAKADIEGGVSLALDLYELDMGRYPQRLEDLIQKPAAAGTWKGPYLKKGLPKDPWGHGYVYRYPGAHNSDSFDLSSSGPDGQEGNEDDVTNWSGGETQKAEE